MEFVSPLIRARLLRRYKRFLADVDIDGAVSTVHCPNPGAMLGLDAPGSTVWISRAANPKRALAHTLELVQCGPEGSDAAVACVNTAMPNKLVEEAIRTGIIAELQGYDTIRREVRYGIGSRIDLLLESDARAACYVEVKNVHLCRDAGLAEFPDCVTQRGAKHLRELSAVVEAGARAVMVYCVQRGDCDRFALAADIDPAYALAFETAYATGVEALVYCCYITPSVNFIDRRIPFAGRETGTQCPPPGP